MDFNSIDWNAMWQAESAQTFFNKSSPKELWDKRAENFNKRISKVIDGSEELDKDDYISKLLGRIKVEPDCSVLDIGCGPGTITIPLARKVKTVTGLDVSSEMLKHLKKNADNAGLSNINYIISSWQDAFKEKKVAEYDIVVASRSLMSGDMKEAISNINSIARQAVYLTLPIVHLPFDWEVYRAIGRKGKKHAPYVYFYNLLYQMGILANIEVLCSKVKVQFPGIEAAIEDLQWRTEPFTEDELKKLRVFLEEKSSRQKDTSFITHEGYSKWALIWWKKQDQE
jgi:SAM-dependent methyltransferase